MFRTLLIASLAAAATPALSAGFDLPARKPGQWELSIQVDTAAMPPQVIRMCIDAETDKMLNNKFGGMASQMCSRQEQKKDGDAIVLESDCRVGDMTTTSRTVVTGSFDSAYTMKSDVQMGGSNATRGVQAAAPKGATSQQTTIQAKYAGECAAGSKPGDIDLGGGRVMNVRDMPDPQPMQ